MSLTQTQCISLSMMVMHLSSVVGYPSGAPNFACTDMVPLHQGSDPQYTIPPFHVELSQYTYKPNDVITVTLSSNVTNRPFRGFLVQVRKHPLLQKRVGTFQSSADGAARSMCNNASESGLTQIANNPRFTLSTTWTAPSTPQGDLQVRVTFVESFTVFWLDVSSQILREAEETTTHTMTTKVTTPSPTTPYLVPEPVTTTSVTTTTQTSTASTTSITSTTTVTPQPPITSRNDLTTKQSQDVGGSKHTVIGTISMEGTTPKTDIHGSHEGGTGSGLALYPSILVCSGLVCISKLLQSLQITES